jgi:hypothetical protein
MLVEEVVVGLVEVLRSEGWIVKDVGNITELKEEKEVEYDHPVGVKEWGARSEAANVYLES